MPVDHDSLARFPERKSSASGSYAREVEDLEARIRRLERTLPRGGDGPGPRPALHEQSPPLDNVYFRQLFDNSPDGIVLLGVDDRVIDVNRGFEELFGYAADEVRRRDLSGLIVPVESSGEAADLSGRVLRGEVVSSERLRRRKDGSMVYVRILGYPIYDGDRLMGLFGIYSDVSFRVGAERRMRLQGAAMSSASSAILITDAAGNIEWVNPSFCRLSGYSEEEVLGRSPDMLAADEESRVFAWAKIRALEPGERWRAHVIHRHKNGHLYTVDQTVTRLSDPANRERHFVIVQEDITARLQAENRLRHLAGHDFLTDLPNRHTFQRRVKSEIERSIRTGRPLAMLLVDIDRLKDINDTFGHAVGDALLIAVAERLAGALGNQCILARFGGDEFAILQPDLFDTGHAAELARRLTEVFSSPIEADGREIHVSISIGVAVWRSGVSDPRDLVTRADLALDEAKGVGRSTFRFYVDGLDRRVRLRMKHGQQLHRAIERQELSLEYQPQVEARTRRIVGFEGLLRWRHPEHGAVPPAEFVPIAEASGLIVPIGAWAMRRACEQAEAWRSEYGLEIPIAVNLSPVQFIDPDLSDTVLATLEETGLPPALLELELTEGLLMDASEAVEATLDRLRERGVRLALDDFGKGYSSLGYLGRFPLDKLKIDGSFVREMLSKDASRVIVSTIAELGRRLDLEVVAEGVESEGQRDALLDEGCRWMQGYLFGRPMPAERISELLAAGRGSLPG